MAMPRLIPAPKEIALSQERVVLDPTWGLVDRSSCPGVRARYADAFGLSRAEGDRNLSLLREESALATPVVSGHSLAEEEYRLEISPQDVTVRAASERGFLHALSTLGQVRNGPSLPVGKVRDYPRLAIRGIQLMFESFLQMGAVEATALITTAAKLKLNTVLLEFGDRFPFERHAAVRAPTALTREELRRLLDHARSLGMEPIPLLQSLGHLNYLLKHDEYAHLREEEKFRDQMCPLNEKSFHTFTELAEEVLSFFPGARFMHIGADETRRLGACPRCREQAARSGKGSLYVGHINKVCGWLSDRGLTPIIWDDILCAHPDVLDALHPGAWVMYWDYWTTSSPSPLLIARYDREERSSSVYDKRWQTEWKAELSDVTAQTLAFFGHPVPLESDLSERFLKVYRRYLGDRFPKAVRAFPYLEFFQDHGRRVICGPTCSGNTSDWLSLPDFARYGNNIKLFAERAFEAEAEGLITTAWYNLPPEMINFGLIATAHFAW